MVTGKKNLTLIISASLKEICQLDNEELMPQNFITKINKGP
jgi:hypothetical protein